MTIKEVRTMVRLRAEFEGDVENITPVTDYKTAENRFEVICENCGKTFYVDQATHEEWNRASEHDHIKAFTCPECEKDYQEAAFA